MRSGWLALAAALLVVWWVWPEAEPERLAEIEITVDGPDGPLWNGTVAAADALEALVQASELGDFTVKWRGSGTTAYVYEVANYGEQGAAGWCFTIDSGDGPRASPVGAASSPLAEGDQLRWFYGSGCDPT